MISVNNNALLLALEDKEFKNDAGKTIEYTTIIFLDDKNDYHVGTITQEARESLPDDLDPFRADCKLVVEITEENGSKGKYLKKRVTDIEL